MSALTQPSPRRSRPASPARISPAAPPRRRLQAVPARQPGPPLVRLVAAVVVLGAMGLLGVLALHTFLAQDAYRLHDAQREAALLKAQEETLARQVDGLNDPGVIASKARKLGMVPGGTPVFVRPDGKTLGAALPKGTKVAYPSAAPSDGLVVVGKPNPSPGPSASASPHPSGSPKPSHSASPAPSGTHK